MTQIAGIESYFPKLQDRFRREGFPVYEEKLIHSPFWEGQSFTIKPSQTAYFTNKENTSTIIVGPSALTIITTDYSRYEVFQERIAAILQTVAAVVEPSIAIRYGLRYVNVIRVGLGRSVEELIKTFLLGSPNLPGASRHASISETLYETENSSQLVLRCTTLSHGSVIPLDLLPFTLSLPEHLKIDDGQIHETFALLDQDHFLMAQDDFDVEIVIRQLAMLNELQHEVFRASVTDNAISEWT